MSTSERNRRSAAIELLLAACAPLLFTACKDAAPAPAARQEAAAPARAAAAPAAAPAPQAVPAPQPVPPAPISPELVDRYLAYQRERLTAVEAYTAEAADQLGRARKNKDAAAALRFSAGGQARAEAFDARLDAARVRAGLQPSEVETLDRLCDELLVDRADPASARARLGDAAVDAVLRRADALSEIRSRLLTAGEGR